VLGVVLLLTPPGHAGFFAAAALVLGVGNQAWPAAHAALLATSAVAPGKHGWRGSR